MTNEVHHPILAGLTLLAALGLIVLLLAILKAASKPVPRVDWNKEEYKR